MTISHLDDHHSCRNRLHLMFILKSFFLKTFQQLFCRCSIVLLCNVKSILLSKDTAHFLHANFASSSTLINLVSSVFRSKCSTLCFVNSDLCEKFLSHFTHVNSFFSSCFRWCVLRLLTYLNRAAHFAHSNGR